MKAAAGSQWPPASETRSGNSSKHRVDTIAFIIHTCSSYAVAQPHEHSEYRILNRPIIIHSFCLFFFPFFFLLLFFFFLFFSNVCRCFSLASLILTSSSPPLLSSLSPLSRCRRFLCLVLLLLLLLAAAVAVAARGSCVFLSGCCSFLGKCSLFLIFSVTQAVAE